VRYRSGFPFLLAIAICGCNGAVAQQPEPLPQKAPGRYSETISVGRLTRRYTLIVPKAYDASRRLPMVVLLHGWMGNASQILAVTGLEAKAEKEGFIVVAPEALGDPKGWNVGFLDLSGENHPDDAGFVASVIDQAEKEVGVDPDRLFVMGHSNGAMLAHLVASKMAGRVAAFGAVAGTIGMPGKETIPYPKAAVSAILLHGQADALVSYDDSHMGLLHGIGAPQAAKWWADRNEISGQAIRTNPSPNEVIDTFSGANGVEVQLVTYPKGSHDWPSGATDLIWAFFARHPLWHGTLD